MRKDFPSSQNSFPVPAPFSPGETLARLRDRLTFDLAADVFDAPIWPPQGDHALNPDLSAAPVRAKPAAVLVPLIAHDEGVNVLLTLRTSKLRNHAGQVAFPGGRMDPEDASPTQTAMREALEEIGLDFGHVEPLGYLEPYQSGTGFRIIPVIGLVRPGFTLTLNEHEVDDAFEVPLSFLMGEDNHTRHRWERDGVMRESWAMAYGERFIWGVTAGIIRRMWERHYRP
ncbi:MAG: CoA pyrophosphatase [Beijerinckiaceae bacterium]